MNKQQQETLLSNLLWLGSSLLVALVVWFIASIEANPIDEQRFLRIPIQLRLPDDVIVINEPPSSASVYIRAQQSILDLLTDDDIVVYADLTSYDPGTYTVPLQVETARRARSDTQPTQITVELQQRVTQLKNVVVVASNNPPATFSYTITEQDIVQVEVSGAQVAANDVVQVEGRLDLADQRSDFERTLTLVPVDADGNRVNNVTLEPRQVTVIVDMVQRDDLREVFVRPNILLETLPENYVISSVDLSPRQVVLSGSPTILQRLGDTVETQEITLENQTNTFTVEVPLSLPSEEIIPLTGTITVTISLQEQTSSLSLQDIPVSVIGIADDMAVQINPETISALLNGPVSQLEGITAQDIQAVIDLNGREAGTYDITPTISIRQGQVNLPTRNITLLPPSISVTLTSQATATPPETTPEANITATPESE